MSLFSENVIPGNHGKIFTTDAVNEADLQRIVNRIQKIEGIKDVLVDTTDLPVKITVHTTSLVQIDLIQKEVKLTGFHIIPKKLFALD